MDWRREITKATGRKIDTKGTRLAAFLNRRIDALTTDRRSRSDIIADMAREAGISVSTVTQILRAEIDCPPIDRLEGFGRALGTSMSGIRSAAERDGCTYNSKGIDPSAGALNAARALRREIKSC